MRFRYITIFADASFCHQTGAAGIAFWVRDSDRIERHSKSLTFAVQNSRIAESIALSTGIIWALNHFDPQPGDRLSIQSDCMQALELIIGAAKNRTEEEFRMADTVVSAVNRAGVTLHPKHVKGHQGGIDSRSHVNEWCDRAAHACMRLARAKMRTEKRVLQNK